MASERRGRRAAAGEIIVRERAAFGMASAADDVCVNHRRQDADLMKGAQPNHPLFG